MVSAGSRSVSPAIPAAFDAFSFAPTYTALAASSPISTTDRPGVTPSATRLATSRATSSRIVAAIAVPLISSPGKTNRPRFSDDHHLDLTGVLKRLLDLLRDVARETRGGQVIDLLGLDDDADLTTRLDRE